jgi:hypothetical protein
MPCVSFLLSSEWWTFCAGNKKLVHLWPVAQHISNALHRSMPLRKDFYNHLVSLSTDAVIRWLGLTGRKLLLFLRIGQKTTSLHPQAIYQMVFPGKSVCLTRPPRLQLICLVRKRLCLWHCFPNKYQNAP